METLTKGLTVFMLFATAILMSCSGANQKSPDVAANIRKSLDQAGLKSVSVSQDRDKGVVTLSGNVAADNQKSQAEALANSLAAGQVVADEIAVVPPADKSDAKTVNSDLNTAIDKNVDAVLIQNQLHQGVKYDVKNGVVTLTGEVNSESMRSRAEQLASTVPNVQQVVNELQVKDQKATSTVLQSQQ